MTYDITDATSDWRQDSSAHRTADYCARCGCSWTLDNGEPNVRADWCERDGCRCHSAAFAAGYAVYQYERGDR